LKAARLIRAAFRRVGFSAPAALELLGPADDRLTPVEQEALWTYRSRGPEPLAVFVRMFVLGQTVSASAARAAWGEDLKAAMTAGMVRRRGVGWQASLALSLHDGLPIFADRTTPSPSRELVPGPTRASLVLERALPRTRVASALELGTGAGLLAIRLGAIAPRVTATDVSKRALTLTALNAALNDVGDRTRLTLVRSDRFAALGRQRFSLVVGNLPFVIAPSRQYRYRDGGLPEDGFTAEVVAGVGRHLQEAGFALLLGQWVHKQGEPEDQRLAPWFVAAGCDALVFRLDLEAADAYAARWSAGPRSDLSPAARVRELQRWDAHLRLRRIQAVSTGLFVLRRRRAARHFMAIDEAADAAATPDWETIAARIAELGQ
jgi:methylase of polypeptide subunit release factors